MRPRYFASVFAVVIFVSGLGAQGSWSAPVVVPELSSSGSDYYPFISRDNLTFRIASSRRDIPGSPGGWDVYRATRTNPHNPFGPITREPGAINGSTNDLGHHFMGDELTAYVANSQSGGVGGHDIWMFTRPSPSANWVAAGNVTPINSTSTDYCVTVSEDHLELYLSSSSRLKVSTRSSTLVSWNTATVVPELNAPTTPVNCFFPSITKDGLTMYLCMSGAPGGMGSYDIYVVTRKLRTDPWGAPVHLPTLASTASDHRPSISPDGRQIFFASTRPVTPPLASTSVWMSMFTGLSYENLPQIGSPLLLHLTHAQKAGSKYQIALAFTANSGIPIPNVGRIPLDLDPLFILTAKNTLPAVFSGFGGQLDVRGEATAQLTIPVSLALIGISFHAAAVTYDGSGINYITNGLAFGIHR